MQKTCFNCRFRYRQLAPDGWGNRPYRCSEKGGFRLAWGQDKGCDLWQEKRKYEATANTESSPAA